MTTDAAEKQLGYYPGCSLEGSAKEFNISLKAVLQALHINMQEIQDWSCCGASSAHAANHVLSLALPARNLLLAKQQGLTEIVAPCAACYNRLIVSKHELLHNEHARKSVEELLDAPFSNGMQILNLVQLFHHLGLEQIKAKVNTPLNHLKPACYYGCLLVRPNDITGFDDAEQPVTMERVIEVTGAKAVAWNYKVECCGASHSIAHTEIVETLSKRILDDARKHGANCIVAACPMCHSNLDMRQLNIKKHIADHTDMPVLYLSEFIGLALGLTPKQLGIDLHFIDAMPVLNTAEVK